MKSLEDLGFHCVDHLPPLMAKEFVSLCITAGIGRVAISLDVSAPATFGNALHAVDELRKQHPELKLLFLEADDHTLIRRYSETRRRHPFEHVGHLLDAIAEERRTLAPFRQRADLSWDTSSFTHARLKTQITRLIDEDIEPRLVVHVLAFGFKHGLASDADIVLDVRFLPNPNYEPDLVDLTGADAPVAEFLEAIPATLGFLTRANELIDFCIPFYLEEGKARLTIAIGCTGGRHRSVYIAHRIAAHLQNRNELAVTLETRDLARR
jgi:UPF0042 nucleotide-binding protein